ncbi:glycosyltransferase family 31 protein [Podospora appendiculata]|uniref:N-acetylgalactosaminide beta-1,3-galactosyltransferase n=1 Tax=Podospora appendiculata TaxID=314037 RepID=A0AAE1CD40_9PEZI|nr:glycosyltransferase family 31 protein [Podospora appendiculata]
MLSRKSLSVLALTTFTLLALLVTSNRLGSWSGLDEPYYHREKDAHDDHKSHYAPQEPVYNGKGDRPPPPPPPSSPSPPPPPAHNASDPSHPPPPMHDKPPRDPVCAHYPDSSNILLIVKTGASESFARLPTQFLTMLKCIPDYLVFSDMDQQVAGHHVHDSLSTVLAEVKDGNSDFDLYRRQQACLVDQENCNKLGNPASEGWNLDKYKNVHIAEKTYAMRPGYDWYVFIDADTYVLWPNLVQWLGKLKANKKHYLGSITLINNFSFGHGGSGYVVSKAAMKDFAGKNPGIANKYDERAKHECCGDYVFAMALKETSSVAVQQVWPTINGEKPATLPFGPSHWCHPIVTMHHMNSEEISTFWEFERRRTAKAAKAGDSTPLLIKDIYTEYLASKLQPKREDWDNRSDDRFYLDTEDQSKKWEDWQLGRMKPYKDYNAFEKKAHLSFEDCAAACESLSESECFQYKYQKGICMFSRSVMLGKPVKEDDDLGHTISGWDVKKIDAWVKAQGECTKILWPEVKTQS